MVKIGDFCCCVCCCFLGNQIIKILGCFKTPILMIYGFFKARILKIFGYFKKLLYFGERNEVEQRTSEYSLTQPARAARDTLTYRQGYPGKGDNFELCDNLLFYSNMKNGRNGMSIDEVHKDWFGNYRKLETCHDFIQWLFPIRELSMYNHQAQELQLHEAKSIHDDPAARQRVLKSYHMMLDFWGMRLEDEKTGVIVRGDNWQGRFIHLNESSHNYLRITRMLKSLGELGFERLKFPFLSFILCEVFLDKTLINASKSCLHYWIHLLRDEEEHGKIRETALEYLGVES